MGPRGEIESVETYLSEIAMRVLIADDDVDGAQMLRVLFEIAGCEVRDVHRGREALAVASQFKPDLFVLDINMPDLDGFETAHELRQRDELDDAVYIAYTALPHAEENDTHRVFDYYVRKPANFSAFTQILAAVGRRFSSRSRSSRAHSTASARL
jgi:DNA-binding response OmpR family regulator